MKGPLNRRAPAIVAIAIPLIVVLASYVGLVVGWNALLHQSCEEAASQLPTAIPQRLLVNVTDEWGRPFPEDWRPRIESALKDALSAYDFSDRIIAQIDGHGVEPVPGDYGMRLAVELGQELGGLGAGPRPWKFAWIFGFSGKMCGNIVLVEYSGDAAIFTLRSIHELGHFFGLPHKEGTYMRTDPLVPGEADRFDAEQLGILEEWQHPGNPYIRHWFR